MTDVTDADTCTCFYIHDGKWHPYRHLKSDRLVVTGLTTTEAGNGRNLTGLQSMWESMKDAAVVTGAMLI